jgi:Ca2+-binding RTX toxin-like protein
MGQAFQYQAFNFNGFGPNNWSNHAVVDDALNYVKSEGANVAVLDWAVDFNKDGSIIPGGSSVSTDNLAYVVQKARSLGLDVFLKPHASYLSASGSQDNIFSYNTDLNVFNPQKFLSDWSGYLQTLTPMANANGVAAIVIGTENSAVDNGHLAEWTSLISSLRNSYHGLLSYDATFDVSQSGDHVIPDVPFWSQLDFIGLSLYVPLSANNSASVPELTQDWTNPPVGYVANYYNFLKDLSVKYGKPVMGLEGGYGAFNGGLDVNWAAASQNFTSLNTQLQANGLQAYLTSLEKNAGNWFLGTTLWGVTPDIWNPVGKQSTAWAWESVDKPAAQIIHDIYTGALSYSDTTFNGTVRSDAIDTGPNSDTIFAGSGGDSIAAGAGNDTIYQSGLNPQAPASNTVQLKIVAESGILNGVAGQFSVYANGAKLGTFDIQPTASGRGNWSTTQTFVLPIDASLHFSQLKITHNNDIPGTGGDERNIWIDAISLDGSSILPGATYQPDHGAQVSLQQALYDGGYALFDTSALAARVAGQATDNDTIDGGPGVDTVVYSGPSSAFTWAINGDGSWTVTDLRPGSPEGVDRLTNVESLRFSDQSFGLQTGTSANEALTASPRDYVCGMAGNDTLTGSTGPDTLFGGDGNDSIVGGSGFNRVNGNPGADTIVGHSQTGDWLSGGQDNDSIDASASTGNNIINGNLGNDTVVGGSGADSLRGGQGDDAIHAGSGNDWLVGDLGANTLYGGQGQDIFRAAPGHDTVMGWHTGDQVQVASGVTWTPTQVGGDVHIAFSNGGEMDLIGVQLNSLPSGWIVSA